MSFLFYNIAVFLILSRNLVKGASVMFPNDALPTAVQLNRSTSLTFGGDDAVLLSAAGSLLTPSSLSGRAQPSDSTSSTPTSNSTAQLKSHNCYFPSEYQGIYQVQSAIDPLGRVQYDELEIGAQDISVWGNCHSLFGQNVLLHISTESGDCFRCFHVTMRTPSILQVNTEGLEKCYTSEDTARSKCPSSSTIKPGDGIFLWRKSGSIDPLSPSTGQNIYRALCPLDGEFTFTYYLNGSPLCETGNTEASNLDGNSHVINTRNTPNNDPNDLRQPLSIISNCPSRDILHATFRSCSFTDRETTFKCLGTWPGEDGQSYVGLMDYYDDSYAKYRCALYKEEKVESIVNGVPTSKSIFHVSLSPDSTCTNELYNATYGFETLELYPIPKFSKRKIKTKLRELKLKFSEGTESMPLEESDGSSRPPARMLFAAGNGSLVPRPSKKPFDDLGDNITCQFPDWMQGDWQYFSIKSEDLFMNNTGKPAEYVFPSDQQQQSICVGKDPKSTDTKEQIILYSQTSCGEESMTCLWIRKKNNGVMEFKRGLPVPIHESVLLKPHVNTADNLSAQPFPPFEICDESYFYGSPWITQLKLNYVEPSVTVNAICPFMGELEAEIGHGEKCTAVSSHCGTPDIFEYKLRTCKSSSKSSAYGSQTYDERHYRCLSSWKDGGFTILLTERLKGEELASLINPEYNSIKARETKNGTLHDNFETQCFVIKHMPKDNSYLIASLNSNCRHVSTKDPSWEDFLLQNGLRFRLTANCSSSWVAHETNEIPASELPGSRYKFGLRKDHPGQTNETAENFNSIYSGIISGSPRMETKFNLHLLTVIAFFSFLVGLYRI